MNNNQDYIICIPSFDRPLIIINKTLKLLRNYNIPNSQIIIFLKDQEQMNLYKDIVANYNLVLTGASGIMDTRNFLQNFITHETDYEQVLFLDDDLDAIYKMDQPLEDLNEFVIEGFKKTKELGLNVFGVSPFHNKFYMKDNVSTTLKYCAGACFGQIFDRKKDLILSDIGHGEDFEFCIQIFNRDGGIVRFNNVAIKTKYFEKEGGICGSLGGLQNRKIEMENNCRWLAETYPDACRLIYKKYGADIRLNYRYKIKK